MPSTLAIEIPPLEPSELAPSRSLILPPVAEPSPPDILTDPPSCDPDPDSRVIAPPSPLRLDVLVIETPAPEPFPDSPLDTSIAPPVSAP
jgi:hypothetical protein